MNKKRFQKGDLRFGGGQNEAPLVLDEAGPLDRQPNSSLLHQTMVTHAAGMQGLVHSK